MNGEYSDEPWFKLQRRLFDSSIWEEALEVRIVWITLVGLAQLPENRKHGHGAVVITRGNLARKAFVTAEQLEHALARLTAPDPTSRTRSDDGRRVKVLENGYEIVNFALHHDVANYERMQEQRVAAGKARAEKAIRSSSAVGRGGRGRFTSGNPAGGGLKPAGEPADAGCEPASLSPSSSASLSKTPSKKKSTTSKVHQGVAEQVIELFNAAFHKKLKPTPGNVAVISDALAEGYEAGEIAAAVVAAAFGSDRFYRDREKGQPDLAVILRFKRGTNPTTGRPTPLHLDRLVAAAGELDLRGKAERLQSCEEAFPGLWAALLEAGGVLPEGVGREVATNRGGDTLDAAAAQLGAATQVGGRR